jgi:hypothetical protein
VPYANLTNPQTLNLYAIVADNPESFADLNGHSTPDLCVDRTTADNGPREEVSAEVQVSQSAADSSQTAKAQTKPTVNVETVEYKASGDGVNIVLFATVKNSDAASFNWIQSVTTNDPVDGKPANKPYLDTDSGQKTPFYLNPKDQTEMEYCAEEGRYDNLL